MDGLVRLVRNPLDNIAANIAHFSRGKTERAARIKAFQKANRPITATGQTPPELERPMATLVRLYVRWHCHLAMASLKVPSLTVFYEDMMRDPAVEIQRILEFSGWRDVPKTQIDNAVRKAKSSKSTAKLEPG